MEEGQRRSASCEQGVVQGWASSGELALEECMSRWAPSGPPLPWRALLVLLPHHVHLPSSPELREAFREFDKDKDGYINCRPG